MSKLNAAKSIRNLATLYKDMTDAAEALEQIGSLEQAADEAAKATASAKGELATTQAELSKAKDKLAAAKATAQEIGEQAAAEALVIQDKAQTDAVAIITQAKQDATGIIGGAKYRAEAIVASGNSQYEVLTGNIAVLKEQYGVLNSDVQAKRRELASLEDKLNTARDGLRKLLG